MTNKLKFLTRMSLNKKIKTKWFLIANLIFMLLIISVINIDSIIKLFGGDFNEKQQILIIDEVSGFDNFNNYFNNYKKYIEDYADTEVSLYDKDYDSGVAECQDDDKKILLVISSDTDNYIKAKTVSHKGIGTITSTLINSVLTGVRSQMALSKYNISNEMLQDINKNVMVENEVLSDENMEEDMETSTIMQIFCFPVFMLIIFLVQMIGAEVNEEKTTKSMEIIISNVSPKTHFISKIIASNLFVIIQGALLILFIILGIGVRYIVCDGNLVGDFGSEVSEVVGSLSLAGVMDTLSYMIPVLLFILILTFIAYSLFAGILASMTTNLEDFQQLQTPIVIVSLIGYYLSMMAGMFKGSIFIRIMSYIPFISSLLSPTLYVMGQVGIVDLIISVLLLIGTIFLLIKYGLRIYKVGILNYSQTGLWKKMFKAMKG